MRPKSKLKPIPAIVRAQPYISNYDITYNDARITKTAKSRRHKILCQVDFSEHSSDKIESMLFGELRAAGHKYVTSVMVFDRQILVYSEEPLDNPATPEIVSQISNEQYKTLLGIHTTIGKITFGNKSKDEVVELQDCYNKLTDILKEGQPCISVAMALRKLDV